MVFLGCVCPSIPRLPTPIDSVATYTHSIYLKQSRRICQIDTTLTYRITLTVTDFRVVRVPPTIWHLPFLSVSTHYRGPLRLLAVIYFLHPRYHRS